MTDAVIVDAVRSAAGRGKPGGALSGVHPVELLAATIRGLTERTGLDPDTIDDVIVGCVSQVGEQAMNVARSAVLAAGFPESVPAVSIDRQCGSSLQAVQFAAASVLAGVSDVVVAGGVESMSRVPMFSSCDGADPYGPAVHHRYAPGLVPQGVAAELIADRWGLDRAQLDEYACRSHQRAAAADFRDEIVPVELPDGTLHARDEGVRPDTSLRRLASLPAVFATEPYLSRFPDLDWRITAGNSSQLADGASAALVTTADRARERGLRPRARIVSMAAVGSDPLLMLTGVVPATERALARAGLRIEDVDAYEVNEAFAPVPLVWAKETGADPDRLNRRGGAIALGHPLGATGTKLLATLLRVLDDVEGRYGLVAICEGGGMANAMVVERVGDASSG